MMTDEEVLFNIKHNSRLNKVRIVFHNEYARIEQAFAQRMPPTLIEWERMEFEAVRRIAAALGAKI